MSVDTPQRQAARAKANAVRSAKAAIKVDLRARRDIPSTRAALRALIEDPPACIRKVPVVTVLSWGWQSSFATGRYLARRAKVDGGRALGDLTDHERQRLALVVQTVNWR